VAVKFDLGDSEAIRLLSEAKRVLNRHWFDNGGTHNNEDVIAMTSKIEQYLKEKQMQLDLSDPDIRDMIHRNHQPWELRERAGDRELIGVKCHYCREDWPCAAITLLREALKQRGEYP